MFLQVYLLATEVFVLLEMAQTLCASLKFCYIAQLVIHDHSQELQDALEYYPTYHNIFKECDICLEGINLPWQHSLLHYH